MFSLITKVPVPCKVDKLVTLTPMIPKCRQGGGPKFPPCHSPPAPSPFIDYLLPLPIPSTRLICCPFLHRLLPLPGTFYRSLPGPVAFTPAPRTFTPGSLTVHSPFPYRLHLLPLQFTLPSGTFYSPFFCHLQPAPLLLSPPSGTVYSCFPYHWVPLPLLITPTARSVYSCFPHRLLPLPTSFNSRLPNCLPNFDMLHDDPYSEYYGSQVYVSAASTGPSTV